MCGVVVCGVVVVVLVVVVGFGVGLVVVTTVHPGIGSSLRVFCQQEYRLQTV